MLSCLSARLSIRPSVPLPSAPPNRHGERGERRGGLIPMLGVVIRSACPFNCVWSDGTTAISFCVLSVWIVWIACPPSYDCRAILRRLVRVIMGSGLGRVRLLPRLLRIPCGFVFFPTIAPPRRPSHPIRAVLLASASAVRSVLSHPCPSNSVSFIPSL